MLVIRVLIFSSIFTTLLTSVSFYIDYSSRMGELHSLFRKIEGSTAKSIALSMFNFDKEAAETLTKGLLSIPEITEIKILDYSDAVYLDLKAPKKAVTDMTISERMASNFFPTTLERTIKIEITDVVVGNMTYIASTVQIYGRLIERLFIFFVTQAAKTFAVSTFILLICQYLFTRKLSLLSETIQRAEREGSFDPSKLNPKKEKEKDYYTEIDVLVNSIIHYHEDSSAKTKDQNVLCDISEKVLWFVRDHEISDFATDNILKNSGLDHCHFYVKEGGTLTLHSSFFRVPTAAPNKDVKMTIPANEIDSYDQIQQFDEKNDDKKISMPIHRGGSLLGVFVGYGSKETVDAMFDKSEFWLTITRVIAMALIHSRLYENLENRIESRTQQLSLSNQELSKAKTQLQSLLDHKNLLIRTLCHDLNNPIATIKGACYKLDLADHPKNEKYRSKIQNALEKQTALIDFIRTSQAIEDGKLSYKLQDIAFKSFIDDALFVFEEKLISKNIKVNYSEEVENLHICVDPVPFGNIIVNNIISNAIKFTEKGGEISIKTRQVEPQNLEITISDNGIGIPKSILDNLFDPHASTTRAGTEGEKGTGFGMPLVKNLVSFFEGDIQVFSKTKEDYPNEHGTSFILTFKLVKQNEKSDDNSQSLMRSTG